MTETLIKADYFVWYNPVDSLYESGDIQSYEACLDLSNQDKRTSLILKFDRKSSSIADRIVKELNTAKENM